MYLITQSTSPTPSLFALIIGINKYADNNIQNLYGAVPDAEEVNKFLLSVVGVSSDRIVNLRDEESNRDAIVGAIRDLTINPAIKQNDPILIFYAGHGAEAKAPPGWPANNATGQVQMLIPHDFAWSDSDRSMHGQGVLDITFSQLLTDLATKKSDNITVILDSCHSGSGTRKDRNDDNFSMRGIELPTGYTIPLEVLNEGAATRAGSIAPAYQTAGLRSHVLLAACMQGQQARERQGHGLFTSALLSVLRKEGVDRLTYKDVITRIGDLPLQNPQCEGVHQNRILFDAKVASPCRDLYRIRASAKPSEYILEAGEAHGIAKKAEFAVYADINMSSLLGMVISLQPKVFNTLCILHPQSEAPLALLPSEPGFALQTRAGEGQDVRVFIELTEKLLDVFIRVGQEMQKTDVEKRLFRLVDSIDDRPHLALTLENDLVQFHIMDKTCRQYGLTHMPVKSDINSDYIYSILRKAADFYRHLYRSNKEGKSATQIVEVKCIQVPKFYDSTWIPAPGAENFNVGGLITINVDEETYYGYEIINKSNVPLYAAMVYFDVGGLGIEDYYLPSTAANGKVDVSLPAKGSVTIGFGACGAPGWNYFLREGQTVDVGFLKLFISTEYVDYSSILQKSLLDEEPDEGLDESRAGRREMRSSIWDTLTIPMVQKTG
ncbi:caspase domain-containing protein [Mycena galopus ATCC 62051]|nr:caspase domain-containing protein [Mycena galopus ATCC 62051]